MKKIFSTAELRAYRQTFAQCLGVLDRSIMADRNGGPHAFPPTCGLSHCDVTLIDHSGSDGTPPATLYRKLHPPHPIASHKGVIVRC